MLELFIVAKHHGRCNATTMKTLSLCTLALLMAACSGCDDEPTKAQTSRQPEIIGCTIKPNASGYNYILDVRQFFERGYAGLAQEVTVATATHGEHRFVEYVVPQQQGHTWHIDRHAGTMGEKRTMRLYAADAQGHGLIAPLVLASNLDGTFTTGQPHTFLVPPDGVMGYVTRQGDVTEWSIEANDAGVTVTIGGKAAFYAAPK